MISFYPKFRELSSRVKLAILFHIKVSQKSKNVWSPRHAPRNSPKSYISGGASLMKTPPDSDISNKINLSLFPKYLFAVADIDVSGNRHRHATSENVVDCRILLRNRRSQHPCGIVAV